MTPLFGGKKGDGGAADRARSAAEREAARLERERRRAEREGRTPPPAPSRWRRAGAGAGGVRAASPGVRAGAAARARARAGRCEPEPASSRPSRRWPSATSRSPSPRWQPEPEPVTVPPEPFEHEHETELHPHVEAPAGVKRVSAPSVGDLPQVGGPRPTPPGPVRGPAGRRTRRRDRPASVPRQRGLPRSRRGARRLVLLLVLLLVVAAAWFAYRVAQPGHDAGDAKRPVAVVIAPGSTAGEIADELADQGVIDSAFFFNIRSRLSGKRGDLKAGRFTLQRDMSYAAALDALTQNPAAAPTVKVTIPEGLSIAETAAIVRQTALSGSYLKAATPQPARGQGLQELRRAARHPFAGGLPLPGDLRAQAQVHRARPGHPAAGDLQAHLRPARPQGRPPQEPQRLRRADHRLDDRARGAGRQGPPPDLGRHLQPPQAAHPARHRRDAALPPRQLVAAAQAVRAASRTRPSTRARARACRRRRSAAPASPRSRRR